MNIILEQLFILVIYIIIIPHQMSLKLASGSYDNTIKFWDPSTGNSTLFANLGNAIPNKIEISSDKTKLAVGMYNTLKIYDVNKNTKFDRSFDNVCKGNITSVGFFKSGKRQHVYISSEDGQIKIFDTNGSKNEIATMKHGKVINCCLINPTDENEMLFADEQGHLKFWKLKTNNCISDITSENQVGIRSISITPNGRNITFSDSRGVLQSYFYEGGNLSKCKSIEAHKDYILKTQTSSNNKYLASCSADKTIKLFKINQNQADKKFELIEYKTLKGHFKWVWDCQFSCDSAYLISCSTDTTIKLWDVQKGELVQTLKGGHEKGIVCLALNDIADN